MSVLVFTLFLFFGVQMAYSQNSQANKHEFLSEARFFADIEKHYDGGIYQLVYSWESNTGLNTLVYRNGTHAFAFQFDVQTAGAPTTRRRINIAGTSYTLRFYYTHKFNENFSFSSGLTHLSSHLSEDVLKIIQNERKNGVIIPTVGFDDINVVFTEIIRGFDLKPFEPKISFRLQPLGVKFHGGLKFYKEPVFISTQIKLLGNQHKNLLFITRHEFGEKSFNDYTLRLDLLKPLEKEEGKLQLLFGYSPGSELIASPNVGWRKEGLSAKMRLVFWAH